MTFLVYIELRLPGYEMNDQDSRSVLKLHNQGKFICYYSELDPFAGQWGRLPPEKTAQSAINEIKILCLVFHHVIIPPGYLIKNPALWVVLSRLKPLFEHGLLSISIDRQYVRHPFLFFEQKLEEEVYHDITGINPAPAKRHDLTRRMKALVENGYFLFRDSRVQVTGFGHEAENLSRSLARKSRNRPQALLEGIKRLKDEGLTSSRDHWMALLYHPSYHPPPDVLGELNQFIHQSYFQQGWIGNHCVMYPSAFLAASYSPLKSSFPFKWFAFHASVIAAVIAHQGINPTTITNLPLDCFIHDLACSAELNLWRQTYHDQVQKLEAALARHFATRLKSSPTRQKSLSLVDTDPGKRIADRLIARLNDIALPLQQSIARLLSNGKHSTPFVSGNRLTDAIPPILPGARFLDLKVRMACGWEPGEGIKKNHYMISFQQREISGPDGGKVKFDRAPFLLFLALLQKNGHVLERHEGVALMERITREMHGPILLRQWDSPADIRSETPISYPEMNRIVAKLRRQLEKIGLDHAIQTLRKEGWRLVIPGNAFVFRDLPAYPPDATGPAFLAVDINAREIRHLDKTCRLGPLPFQLFQLLVRYNGVAVNTRLINLELGLIEEPLSTREYSAVQDRVRQYVAILGEALSAIKAPVRIVSEYGIGWRLSPLK